MSELDRPTPPWAPVLPASKHVFAGRLRSFSKYVAPVSIENPQLHILQEATSPSFPSARRRSLTAKRRETRRPSLRMRSSRKSNNVNLAVGGSMRENHSGTLAIGSLHSRRSRHHGRPVRQSACLARGNSPIALHQKTDLSSALAGRRDAPVDTA